MTDTNKKKKLLEENKDIYISDYDKTLSYNALSQIIDAKKRYAQAAKEGNKEEMTRSNNEANAIRAKYGNYTAGNSGSEYKPFVNVDTDYDDYSSKYDDDLDDLYNSIVGSRKSFEYDYTKDPAYKAYKTVYDKQGQLAYNRALAENSLKTGGVENTNAQSAAMQALGYYNSQLAAKIPELYEAAFQRHYKDEQSRMDGLIAAHDILSAREERDYSRHLDKLASQRDLRDFSYRQQQDAMDRMYRADSDEWERNYQTASDEWDRNYKTESDQRDRELELVQSASETSLKNRDLIYDLMRDSIDDEKWRVNHNLDAYKKGYPSYRGEIGTTDVLGYARILFGNPSLTMEDLYNILDL